MCKRSPRQPTSGQEPDPTADERPTDAIKYVDPVSTHMPEAGETAETDRSQHGKVGRLIEKYDLQGLGDELERRWTAEGDERASLRDLADMFNRRLLEQAMREAGTTSIGSEVDNLYRLLTSDDVTSGVRTRAENRLQREGLDVEQLQKDFVSYQAIRTYLKKYRGASYDPPSDRDQIEKDGESIQRLRSRLTTVTEEKLERLRDTERITLGDFRLFTEIDVLCEECGSQYPVSELLDRGGCDCDQE